MELPIPSQWSTKGPRAIIAIDPGGTTGIAWHYVLVHRSHKTVGGSEELGVQLEQIGPCDSDIALKELLGYISSVASRVEPMLGRALVHLLVEPFQFRKGDSYRDKIDYIAAEVVGALRIWALDRPYVKFIRQGASEGKGFWVDDKIKRLGLWVPGGSKTFQTSTPGKNHAMDALRHLLHYRTFVLRDIEILEGLKQ